MKTYKLIINPFAEIDMNVAQEWYELKEINLGNKFIDEIGLVLFQIRKNPFQFPEAQNNIRKAVTKRFPFSIFYTVHIQSIIIFAVFHNSRNPIIWKNRLR